MGDAAVSPVDSTTFEECVVITEDQVVAVGQVSVACVEATAAACPYDGLQTNTKDAYVRTPEPRQPAVQQRFDAAYGALQTTFWDGSPAPGARLNGSIRKVYDMQTAWFDGAALPPDKADKMRDVFAARASLVDMRIPRQESAFMGAVGKLIFG